MPGRAPRTNPTNVPLKIGNLESFQSCKEGKRSLIFVFKKVRWMGVPTLIRTSEIPYHRNGETWTLNIFYAAAKCLVLKRQSGPDDKGCNPHKLHVIRERVRTLRIRPESCLWTKRRWEVIDSPRNLYRVRPGLHGEIKEAKRPNQMGHGRSPNHSGHQQFRREETVPAIPFGYSHSDASSQTKLSILLPSPRQTCTKIPGHRRFQNSWP